MTFPPLFSPPRSLLLPLPFVRVEEILAAARTRWKGTLIKMLSLQSRQVEKRQIVLDVERGERTTNQNPRFSKDKHWKLLGGVVKGLGGVRERVCACVSLHFCVCSECTRVQDKSGTPLPPHPHQNISKIATANQTECKSALWKGLEKKSFEGHRKTGIHFSPFTVPGA